MSTIPISEIIALNPSVLSVGGGNFALTGLVVTENTRVPIGTVSSFNGDVAVEDFFGPGQETNIANVYFDGYDTKTQTPAKILYVQYNQADVAAYMRGGNVSGLTLSQLQAIDGTLTIVIDGYTWTSSSVNLAAATSFSSAATIITADLTVSPPAFGTSTSSGIASETNSCTGSIEGYLATVSGAVTGTLYPGTTWTGTGVTSGTMITSQLSGTTGGDGIYVVNKKQNVTSTTLSGTYGLMTIGGTVSAGFAPGQNVTGSGIPAGVEIMVDVGGSGAAGTYVVNNNTVVSTIAIDSFGTNPVVTYDSVSGAFIVTSGLVGALSTIAYATGTIAASLELTAVTGAVLSQGAQSQLPGAFMTSVTGQTQAWANFMTAFDPDNGSGSNTQRLLFAQWVSEQNSQYCYICYDSSLAPTTANPATSSLGYAIEQAAYSGVNLNWEPNDEYLAAFVCGMFASVNFNQTNGRITAAFKSQSGLTAGVTDPVTAGNLQGNGYNYCGAYGNPENPASPSIFYYPGTVSGPFTWLDTYENQIWLNRSFQGNILALLIAANSIPYNSSGYAQVEAALQPTITAAVNCGVIRAGVQLSSSQVAEVNEAAGGNVAPTIQSQGYYLQVVSPSPAVRQARGTPVINFWYCDGESVQQVTIASIVLQ